MKSIKGSKTEKNLLISFAGESQARNRYNYFSGQAKKDGFVQIANIFAETADQEKEHAKRFFKFLEGGDLEITAAFPAGIIAGTYDNLVAAADGEQHEHMDMYPGFAKIAEAEGFNEIALVFKNICVAEAFHEKRFRDFAANIKEGRVFKREQNLKWRCINCGFVHEGNATPGRCPACDHPIDHFELLGINW